VAVYRESPPVWRRYLPIVIGVLVVLAAVIAVIVLSRATANVQPTSADPLTVIAQSLDLFSIEYTKVSKGTPPAQTGAPGALARAQASYKEAQAALKKIDEPATTALGNDLTELQAILNGTGGTSANVDTLIADASAQVVKLQKASTPTPR
jgi:hypothetical protein